MSYTDYVAMKDLTMPEVQRATFTEFNVRRDKGKPSFIRLHDSVVQHLERLLVLGGDQPGILLGTVEVGATCTFTVEDSVPSANLEERIQQWKPRAGSQQIVLGCYRCYSRPEFGLDQADRALFRRCFPTEERLLLQVKPPKANAGTAMFFLGEDGKLSADRGTVEFPFNLRDLGAEEPPAAAFPLAVAVAIPQPAPAVAPQPRAPVVVAKASGGKSWKLGLAGVAVVASVVGLSGLRVFDGRKVRPKREQPAAEQPAATNPSPAVPNAPKPAPTPKTVALTPRKTAPAPIAQTFVADNAVGRLPAPFQPVMQTLAPPPPEVVAPVQLPPPTAAPTIQAAKPVQPALPLTPPRVIHQTAPEVQDRVRRSITGEVSVKVRVNIDATGKVISAESVSKGNPVAEALAGSAIAAVKRWKFEPAQRGAEKVPGDVVLSFTFRK